MYLRVFLTFHTGLFVISRVVRDVLVFLCLIFKFFIPKSCCRVLNMRYAHVASMLFGRRMRHHSVVKPGLPLCYWKRHCILFLLVWRVMVDDEQFVIDSRFFFLPSYFLSTRESACLFFLLFFLFNSLCFLFLIFVLGLFRKKFMFSIYSLNHNLSYIIFTNSLFILLISIFFLGSFVKVLLVFNFILQSKFMLFYLF